MRRTGICLAAMLLVAGSLHVVSAQTATAPAGGEAKPSHMKLTKAKLHEMMAKWKANRPKLKACRKEVKAKGLSGDDRWFYIEDCMDRT
jgi:tRNA(Ile2) C34 agmatinyltransferase TiaS